MKNLLFRISLLAIFIVTILPSCQKQIDSTASEKNWLTEQNVIATNSEKYSKEKSTPENSSYENSSINIEKGLIAYYQFNGNAMDLTQNHNDGIVYGAVLTKDRFNKNNSAYSFSSNSFSRGALSNEIFLPYNSVLNVPKITISFWIKPTAFNWFGCSGPCQANIINRFQNGYSSPNGQVFGTYLFSNAFGTLQGIYGGFTGPDGTGATISAASVSSTFLNSWHNISVSYDMSSIKVYVDGLLASSELKSNGINILGTSGISIGISNQANGYWDPFDGTFDDLRIYDRPLTQAEIYYLARH